MRISPPLAVTAAAALTLVACGGGNDQAAPAQTVVVTVSASPAPSESASPSPSAVPSDSASPTDSAVPSDSASPSASGLPTDSAPPSGSAPAPGGGFSPSFSPDGRANPATWPDACKLVTTQELKSLLPDAINVRSAGQRGAFLSGGETPNYVNCKHQITLPTDSAGSPTTVDVKLENVADPRIIKAKHERDKARAKKFAVQFPDQYKDYGSSMGAEDCFLDINQLSCRSGAFAFEVGGRHFDINETDYKKSQAEWREKTLSKVVKLIAEKIKSGGSAGAA